MPRRSAIVPATDSSGLERPMVGLFLLTLFLTFPGTCAAQIQFEPYVFETIDHAKIAAEMGHLLVPQRHREPAGSKIQLAFIRVKSTAAHPEPPIVYLAGGPGGSGISLARGPRYKVILGLREVADVIALDQRGTGLTTPELNCLEGIDYPLDRAGEPGALLNCYEKTLQNCAVRLRANGVDLQAYNTEESADDLESLRRALGVEKISLFGSSYGTHLGLSALRRHGDKIHRAVLSGIEGPDQTLKLPRNLQRDLERTSQLARADKQVAQRIPDLLELVKNVLNQLASRPLALPIINDTGANARTVTIGKFDLQQETAGLLGTREGRSAIPALYYGLSIGDYRLPAIQMLVQDVVAQRTLPLGTAMGLAMDCASGASLERRRNIQDQARDSLLGGEIDFPIPQLCEACGLPELPDSFRAPFHCEVSTLFISGTLDGRTPPENAAEVREGFANSRHVLIEGAGHGNELFTSSPEIKDLILEFMKTGKITTEMIRLPTLVFQDLLATSAPLKAN